MQEVQQVVGILSGGIDTDDEVDRVIALDDPFESLTELGIARGRLGELQFGRRRLQVVAQERGLVPVARGADADQLRLAGLARGRLRNPRLVW